MAVDTVSFVLNSSLDFSYWAAKEAKLRHLCNFFQPSSPPYLVQLSNFHDIQRRSSLFGRAHKGCAEIVQKFSVPDPDFKAGFRVES